MTKAVSKHHGRQSLDNPIRAVQSAVPHHLDLEILFAMPTKLTAQLRAAPSTLAEALDVETQALDAYKDFLPRVAGDAVLEDFIRKQIDLETEHVQEIVNAVRAGRPLKLLEKPTS